MVVATMNVAENVAGGSVQVCAGITGVGGMLECSVSTTATTMGRSANSVIIIMLSTLWHRDVGCLFVSGL